MHRLFSASMETACAAVFLFPIFLYLNKISFRSMKTTVFSLLFALYLCTVYAIAGLPNITYIRFDPNFNLVPFQYFFSDETTLLNVILFIPLGLFLPLLREKYRNILPTILFGFLMSVFVEVFQIFTLRASDINDLFTNTFGSMVGYILGKLSLWLFPKFSLNEVTNELKLIVGSVVFVMFFLQPVLSGLLWKIYYM